MAKITKRPKIQSSKPSEMPGFIRPQLATLKAKAPPGDQWLHEIKYDGYPGPNPPEQREAQSLHPQRVGLDEALFSHRRRSGYSRSGDPRGEVVVVHEGRTNFSELQAELAAGNQDRLVYYAFDLLWRDGDLRKLPQIERKQALSDLLGENGIGSPIVYSEHLTGERHTGIRVLPNPPYRDGFRRPS